MRKLYSTIFALAMTFVLINFYACGSDEDEKWDDTVKKLEGSWYLYQTTFYDWDRDANKAIPIPNHTEITMSYERMTWILTKQGEEIHCAQKAGKYNTNDYIFYHESGNAYYTLNNLNRKSVRYEFNYISDEKLEVGKYQRFYDESHDVVYCVYTFIR